MFKLEHKIIQRYKFFAMCDKSLQFTSGFWIDFKNIFLNLDAILAPGLDKYDQLALEGNIETMFQWMLRIAIFYWKFLPTMLSEFFKYFPMFNVPFGALEISIFDYWLELPECIDELYNIILENNWSPHMPTEKPQFSLHAIILGAHTSLSQDVWDYKLLTSSDYNTFLDDFLSLQDPVLVSFFLDHARYLQKDIHDIPRLPIFFYSVPYFNSLDLRNFLKYYFIYKQFYNEDWMSEPPVDFILDFFIVLLEKSLFFTRQLLCVNNFLDYSEIREQLEKNFLALSIKTQLEITERLSSRDLTRKAASRFSKYSSYEDWVTDYNKRPKEFRFPILSPK